MDRLVEQLAPHFPRTRIVRDLVESVQRLPGLEGWSLPEPAAPRGPTLLQWGLSIWMTRMVPGADQMGASLGAEILASGSPKVETLAELSGAALCVALGAAAAGRIPTGPGKTADWRMVWADASEVDVEITVAMKKAAHVVREAAARNLADVLRGASSVDLIVDVADPTDQEACESILRVVDSVTPENPQAAPGRWRVRAETGRQPLVSGHCATESVQPIETAGVVANLAW